MANIREYRDKSGKLISFHIKVYRGRDSDGHQLSPYCTTFKVEPNWTERRAKREVEKFALIFEDQCKRGSISTSSMTLSECMNYTIELKNSRGQIKRRTYALYVALSKKISADIGSIPIKDITVKTLNDYYTNLSKRLSAKSVSEYHGIIYMALSQAVKEGQLVTNVAQYADKPKIPKNVPNYFQKDELLKILDAADNESIDHKCLIYLFVFTGCRRGEIAGLKWDAIDFTNNIIHICNNVLYSPMTGVYEDTPKTSTSDRFITIPDTLIDLLRIYKKSSRSQIFVFCNPLNNGPIHPDSISKYLTKFSKRYDLPHINSHAFRHSMASLLYYEGMDVVSISARLGHSKVSTTANLYAHTINKYDQDNCEKLSDILIKSK